MKASTWLCWKVLEACKGPSWGQQAYGDSTVQFGSSGIIFKWPSTCVSLRSCLLPGTGVCHGGCAGSLACLPICLPSYSPLVQLGNRSVPRGVCRGPWRVLRFVSLHSCLLSRCALSPGALPGFLIIAFCPIVCWWETGVRRGRCAGVPGVTPELPPFIIASCPVVPQTVYCRF